MPDIFLYPGEPNPDDIRLRDPSQAATSNVVVTPATAILVLTTFAPPVLTPRVVVPTTATLVLTGYAPSVATPRLVIPGTATLTLTGYRPIIARIVVPNTAALTLTTYAPNVTATQTTARVVIPETAHLFLTGFAPSLPDLIAGSPGGHGAGNLARFTDEDHFAGPPYAQPHVVEEQPLEVPDITPVLPLVAKVDNRPAVIALYQANVIDEETFVALLAAA